jgi:hypothetical protein
MSQFTKAQEIAWIDEVSCAYALRCTTAERSPRLSAFEVIPWASLGLLKLTSVEHLVSEEITMKCLDILSLSQGVVFLVWSIVSLRTPSRRGES